MSVLFLMRHSFAEAADFQTTDDSRCLTARGRVFAREAGQAVARMLQSENLSLECIVTSPLVRTVQTGELVAAELGYENEIRALFSLRSESPCQRAIDDLRGLGHGVVLAVTHEPIVSSMSSRLQGEPPSAIGPGFHPSEIRGFRDESVIWRHEP